MEKQILLVMDIKHKMTGRHLIIRQSSIPRGMWGIPRISYPFPLPDDEALGQDIKEWIAEVFPALDLKSTQRLLVPYTVGFIRVVQVIVTGTFDKFNPDNPVHVRGAMDPEHPEKEFLDTLTRILLPHLNGKD